MHTVQSLSVSLSRHTFTEAVHCTQGLNTVGHCKPLFFNNKKNKMDRDRKTHSNITPLCLIYNPNEKWISQKRTKSQLNEISFAWFRIFQWHETRQRAAESVCPTLYFHFLGLLSSWDPASYFCPLWGTWVWDLKVMQLSLRTRGHPGLFSDARVWPTGHFDFLINMASITSSSFYANKRGCCLHCIASICCIKSNRIKVFIPQA